jgi:DNA invertase Pin-like site-specific DNA recombinase
VKDRSAKGALRCAIYTRVSTDQGLEQDFNSLDAQREASEAYIKSQAHEATDPGSIQRRRLLRRVDGQTGPAETAC